MRVRAVHLPGHTAGHCVLLVEPQGIAFIGDFDLSSFGPYYGDATSSLTDFRRSLQRLADLPASVWITSHHKGVIDDRAQFDALLQAFAGRIDEREARLLQMLAAGPQSLEQLVGQRLLYPPEADDLWVGCAEARSIVQHLDELVRRRPRGVDDTGPLPAGRALSRPAGAARPAAFDLRPLLLRQHGLHHGHDGLRGRGRAGGARARPAALAGRRHRHRQRRAVDAAGTRLGRSQRPAWPPPGAAVRRGRRVRGLCGDVPGHRRRRCACARRDLGLPGAGADTRGGRRASTRPSPPSARR